MKKIVTLITALCLFNSTSIWAEILNFPHIETTGYGEIIAKPDMAEFTVRVEESTLTAEDAKARVDAVVAAFIERLEKEGVSRDSISATNIELTPKYHYPKAGESELVGYRASRRITVTVNQLEKLNTYLDGAIGDGINRIDNIQLKVKDHKKYQEQARMTAIKDANEKAHSLSGGFDMKLDGVWRISYNSAQVQPLRMKGAVMANQESAFASYQDSTIVIRDQVTVIYRLK